MHGSSNSNKFVMKVIVSNTRGYYESIHTEDTLCMLFIKIKYLYTDLYHLPEPPQQYHWTLITALIPLKFIFDFSTTWPVSNCLIIN